MFDNMILRFKFRYHILVSGSDHITIKPFNKLEKFNLYLKKHGYQITMIFPTYINEVTFLEVYIDPVV